jgi:hypothetical protein
MTRSVVLVFDVSTLANYPSHQIGTHGKSFVRKLIANGIHIIPFVVSARYTPEEATPFIHNFFSNIPGFSDVKFAHNTNQQELYTENTVELLYRAHGNTSGDMPPVYFFDRDPRHVSMMHMFRSFHITRNDSWDTIAEEITSLPISLNVEGGSPAVISFAPGTQLGVEPQTPRLGGRRASGARKARKSRKARAKK